MSEAIVLGKEMKMKICNVEYLFYYGKVWVGGSSHFAEGENISRPLRAEGLYRCLGSDIR